MRQLLTLTILTSSFLSCRSKTETITAPSNFQLLIPDTSNNSRAHRDLVDITYRSKIENKIGLSDLKRGADSLEVRLWYDFSFSNSKELYLLKFQDTSCLLSYYRVYPRQINYDDPNRNQDWDPFTDPIIDSSISKSVLLTKDDFKQLHIDSIWFLKSQSELKISDSIGFTDCDSYIIEIANKKRFKYLRYHCAFGYYNKTKLTEILSYLDFCGRITALSRRHNAIIPYNFD
jgi:hypothetical protein